MGPKYHRCGEWSGLSSKECAWVGVRAVAMACVLAFVACGVAGRGRVWWQVCGYVCGRAVWHGRRGRVAWQMCGGWRRPSMMRATSRGEGKVNSGRRAARRAARRSRRYLDDLRRPRQSRRQLARSGSLAAGGAAAVSSVVGICGADDPDVEVLGVQGGGPSGAEGGGPVPASSGRGG